MKLIMEKEEKLKEIIPATSFRWAQKYFLFVSYYSEQSKW